MRELHGPDACPLDPDESKDVPLSLALSESFVFLQFDVVVFSVHQ